MITKLVWENVKHRPMPTLLSILLIGVPVTLILVLVGLSNGLVSDSQKRQAGVGADVVVRQQNSSLMTFSGSTIPEQLVTKLAGFPHVTQATGVVNQSAGGLLETVTGIDPLAFKRMSGGFTFIEGGDFRKPDDIILDRFYAEQKKVHAGSKLQLINHDWNVVGIVEPGKLSHIFVEIGVLQDLFSTPHMVSQIYLRVDRPESIQPTVEELKKALPGYPIYPMKYVLEAISVQNVPALGVFINVIIGIAVLIAFAVVCLSMYMAVLQRTREIGILKAIGASKSYILRIILAEAFLMGIGGTILGILMSFGTRWILLHFVPSSLPQAIVPHWWPRAGAIALAAALIGALYPGLTAAQQDPIRSLAYE